MGLLVVRRRRMASRFPEHGPSAWQNLAMSQKQLVAEIDRRFRSVNRRERIEKIRQLAGASTGVESFIRQNFPELYSEAFQVTSRLGVRAREGTAC